MKKIIPFILALTITFPAFAVDTTLENIYLTDKQISQSGNLISENINGFVFKKTENKIVVASNRALTESEIKSIRNALSMLPDEYAPAYIEAQFSFKTLMGRLNQELPPASILRLSPYTGALESFVEWKNFSGIKQFLAGLAAIGTLTEEDRAIIDACFLEQGIDFNA